MKKHIIAVAVVMTAVVGFGCATPPKETEGKAAAKTKAPVSAVPEEPEREFYDEGKAIRPTKDAGFIVAAETSSRSARDKDVWLLKLDAKGQLQWERTYGGADTEMPEAVIQSKDGGFVVAATRSYLDKGAKTDGWIFKVDEGGNTVWDKILGGDNYEYIYDIAETPDGGLVVAAATASKGAGLRDAWVIKMNGGGAVEWEGTFGEGENDDFRSVETTNDGGFLVAGGKGQKGTVYQDGWVVRLGSDGKKVWEKTVVGRFNDEFGSVRPTADGGAIAVGDSQSNDEQLSNMWLVKLSRDGDLQWEKQHGGTKDDRAVSVVETKDGDYVVCGKTSRELSEDEAIVTRGQWGESKNYLSSDLTVMKLGKDGAILWEKKHGGKQEDCAEIAITSDGYVLAGWTMSKAKKDSDVWVVALDGNGEAVWDKVFGE